MVFVDDGGGDSDERKRVICTDQEILYMAPITDEAHPGRVAGGSVKMVHYMHLRPRP